MARELLFGASPELAGYAQSNYRLRSPQASGMLSQLLEKYQGEGLIMPYTWTDFYRDYITEHFPELSPDEPRECWDRCRQNSAGSCFNRCRRRSD